MISKSPKWGDSPSKCPKWLTNRGYWPLTNWDDPPSTGNLELSHQKIMWLKDFQNWPFKKWPIIMESKGTPQCHVSPRKQGLLDRLLGDDDASYPLKKILQTDRTDRKNQPQVLWRVIDWSFLLISKNQVVGSLLPQRMANLPPGT